MQVSIILRQKAALIQIEESRLPHWTENETFANVATCTFLRGRVV